MSTLGLVAVAVLPVVGLIGVLGLRAPLRVLMPLYAAFVPFGSSFLLPIGVPSPFNSLTSLLGLGVILGLGVHAVFLQRAGTVRPEAIAWTLFGAVNGLTFIWSIDRSVTADRILILYSLLALYVLVSLVPCDLGDLRRLADAIVVGATLAAGYGFYLLLTGALPEEKAGLPRFATAGGAGDASDPNITAATFVLPITLALSRTLRATTPGAMVLGGGATALMTIGVLLTASRGGTLAVGVAVVIVLAHGVRPVRAAVVVAAGAVAVVLVSAALAPEQVDRIQTSDSSGRTDIYQVGWAACQEHCLTGSGLDTFREVHRRYYLATPEAVGARIDEPPHNIWLGAAIEVGLAGLTMMGAAIALTVRSVLSLPRTARGAPLGALAGLLTSNMFLGNLYFKYFWLVLIVAVVAKSAHEHHEDAPPPGAGRALPRHLVVQS